jgi:hypothetical protein
MIWKIKLEDNLRNKSELLGKELKFWRKTTNQLTKANGAPVYEWYTGFYEHKATLSWMKSTQILSFHQELGVRYSVILCDDQDKHFQVWE